MTVNELLAILSLSTTSGAIGVRADSRLVNQGDVFVAIAGGSFDGHNFIGQAIESGAKYIVCERPNGCKGAEVIVVADSAEALGILAQAAHGRPAEKLTNLAVTGTNGKTTVTFLVRSVIEYAHKKCGLVGTIVTDTAAKTPATKAKMTTPDAIATAGLGKAMVEAGAEFMVIEASSHALAQRRLAGINFKAAAFTNLSGDHLDYHKTIENYLDMKKTLFEKLAPDATAVLNKQSPESEIIAKATKAKKLFYGIDAAADIVATIKSMDINEIIFELKFNGQVELVKTPLVGLHNVSNHLAAAGLCLGAGFDLKTIAAGLSALECVPGRLEHVNCGQDFAVLIDYAHTDDALKIILGTLRPLCKNKLTIVFGCGGDRDSSKRPRMAKIAEGLADKIIITNDNPRSENPQDIAKDITAGFASAKAENIEIELDRNKAITKAIMSAEADDIVVIAGKGHETYQILGEERIHFSDVEVAVEILNKL